MRMIPLCAFPCQELGSQIKKAGFYNPNTVSNPICLKFTTADHLVNGFGTATEILRNFINRHQLRIFAQRLRQFSHPPSIYKVLLIAPRNNTKVYASSIYVMDLRSVLCGRPIKFCRFGHVISTPLFSSLA